MPSPSPWPRFPGAVVGDSVMHRRRRVRRPEIDRTVPSPCVAVCKLDDDGICIGCLRSTDEIRDWMIMNREQKLAVLEAIATRRLASRNGDS